jgi:hypothetical protein
MNVRKGQNGIIKRFSKNKSKRRNGKAEYLCCKCIFYACKSCERDSQKGIVRKETVHNWPFLAIMEELIPYIKTSALTLITQLFPLFKDEW